MVPNRISVALTQEQRDEIKGHLAALEEMFSFLIALSERERKELPKIGDSVQGFIRKSLEVGQVISDYLPRALSLEEMKKDVTLMDDLYPIMLAISKLATKLSDTYRVAQTEAYSSALLIYRNSKAVESEEGLKEPIAELKRRFARRNAASKPEPAAAHDGKQADAGEPGERGRRRKKRIQAHEDSAQARDQRGRGEGEQG